MEKKPQKGSKAKKGSRADDMIRGAKKVGVELSEKELDTVAGGAFDTYIKFQKKT